MNAKQIAQGEGELVSKQLRGTEKASEDFDYMDELTNKYEN